MNYTGYYVDAAVTNHSANGVGVYSYFRDNAVVAGNGFKVPDVPGVSLTNAFTLFLTGNAESKILHVINEIGAAAESGPNQGSFVCTYSNGKYTL